MSSSDRRQHPRFDVQLDLTTEISRHAVPVTLLNVSVGGFAVESTESLPGVGHLQFAFTTRDGSWSASFLACPAWVRLDEATRDRPVRRYLAGFSFLETGSAEVRHRIDQLMEHAAGVVPSP